MGTDETPETKVTAQSTTTTEGQLSTPVQPLRGHFNLSEVFVLIQAISIIVTGAWTVYVFTKYDSHEKQLAAIQAEQNVQKSSLEIEKLNAAPLDFDTDLSIDKFKRNNGPRSGELIITFHYAVKNLSDRLVEVPFVVVRCFVLNLPPRGESKFQEVPGLTTGEDSVWKPILSRGYFSDSETSEGFNKIYGNSIGGEVFKGGGGTGFLEHGETNFGSMTFITAKQAGDFAGCHVETAVHPKGDQTIRFQESDRYDSIAVNTDSRSSPEKQ